MGDWADKQAVDLASTIAMSDDFGLEVIASALRKARTDALGEALRSASIALDVLELHGRKTSGIELAVSAIRLLMKGEPL